MSCFKVFRVWFFRAQWQVIKLAILAGPPIAERGGIPDKLKESAEITLG